MGDLNSHTRRNAYSQISSDGEDITTRVFMLHVKDEVMTVTWYSDFL